MLYNPKWQKTPDNCEITLRNFQQWVDAQNPKGRYCYPFRTECAVGRWLQATDHQMLLWTHWPDNPVLWQADYIAAQRPHTFGTLSNRLRALSERQ